MKSKYKKLYSTKLHGSLLREVHKVASFLRKEIGWSKIIESEKMNTSWLDPKKGMVEIAPGIFILVKSNKMVPNPVYDISIIDKDGRPLVHQGMPTHITSTELSIPLTMSWFNSAKECDRRDTDGPALINLGFIKYSQQIKLLEYRQRGILHSLKGPAVWKYCSVTNKIRHSWFIFGKEYPISQIRGMVDNPFSIGKREQMYLKLALAPLS